MFDFSKMAQAADKLDSFMVAVEEYMSETRGELFALRHEVSQLRAEIAALKGE